MDNVAFTTPNALGSFTVRCSELCGIWHGAMFNYGRVVTQSAFQSWASGVQAKEQSDGILAALPPYALTYDPTVIPQLGKNLVTVIGITGAPGISTGLLTRCSHDALPAADSGARNVRHDLGEGVTGWPSRHSRIERSPRAVVLRSAGPAGSCGHGGCVRESISA